MVEDRGNYAFHAMSLVRKSEGGIFVHNGQTERLNSIGEIVKKLIAQETQRYKIVVAIKTIAYKDEIDKKLREAENIHLWKSSHTSAVLLLSYAQLTGVVDEIKDTCTVLICDAGEKLNSKNETNTKKALCEFSTHTRMVFLQEGVTTDLLDFFQVFKFVFSKVSTSTYNFRQMACGFCRNGVVLWNCEVLFRLNVFHQHKYCQETCRICSSTQLQRVQDYLNPQPRVFRESPLRNAPHLRIIGVNAQGMNAKTSDIIKIIRNDCKGDNEKAADVVCICETKLAPTATIPNFKVGQYEYKFHRNPKRHVGIFVRSGLEVKAVDLADDQLVLCTNKNRLIHVFALDVKINANTSIRIISVYKQPTYTTLAYVKKFLSVLKHLVERQKHFLITGDFNLHVDWTKEKKYLCTGNKKGILNMLQDFVYDNNFDQSVRDFTYIETRKGKEGANIYDLVITPKNTSPVPLFAYEVTVNQSAFADHMDVKCNYYF
ncbi:hypothetical protein L596_025543 [Steinernema carpocapsae]|uniref:Endonuclease/exonuclease/phosphatase domain-containing protein n=2 Tax=Steinernema carpocapsae TaxID=34508 RepID=A0A4U5M820_STECR|nr:hypothetical protein L596_025543 [Steinernema carpocapsae]